MLENRRANHSYIYSHNYKQQGIKAFSLLILLLFVTVFSFPMVFTIANSFMNSEEINSNYSFDTLNTASNNTRPDTADKYMDIQLIPEEVTTQQFYKVLISNTQYLDMFWNSIKVVIPIVCGQIMISLMAAYGLSLLRTKWSEYLFFAYIVIMLMPFQVTLVPNYIIADQLGLIGSYVSIILPGIFSTFGVFLLTQYMTSIPNEYIEAAKMDGANSLEILINVIIPMFKTGIAALAILTFIDNWNMVEQPLIFIKDIIKQPLSIYLAEVNAKEPGIAFAASVFYMLPMLLSFLYWRDYLVEGIELSGIKG